MTDRIRPGRLLGVMLILAAAASLAGCGVVAAPVRVSSAAVKAVRPEYAGKTVVIWGGGESIRIEADGGREYLRVGYTRLREAEKDVKTGRLQAKSTDSGAKEATN